MSICFITQILRGKDKSVEIKVVFEINFLKFTNLSLSFLFEMIKKYLTQENVSETSKYQESSL